MKGSRTLIDQPFRYGGIMHDYEKDNEEWTEYLPDGKRIMRCWCCGGVMRNSRSINGTLLKRNFPYTGMFRITKGYLKGGFRFKMLCRACAYDYERGVIEMDGETYKRPDEFNESKYKESDEYKEWIAENESGGDA